MLRPHHALVPAALVFVAAACENSSSNSGGLTPGLDGGPNVDGGPSASPEAAAPATGVIVNVVNGSKPVANVRVLFHDPAGEVTADHTTDATGKVVAATAPSQVTVTFPGKGSPSRPNPGAMLITYTAVAEGDVLTVDMAGDVFDNEPIGSFDVTLPGAVNGSEYYELQMTQHCSDTSGGETVGLPLRATCVRAENHLLAAALNPADAVLSYAWKKGATLPANDQTANVTLDAWTAGGNLAITIANAPQNAQHQSLLTVIAGGSDFYPFGQPTGDELDTGGRIYSVPPASFATAHQTAAILQLDRGTTDLSTLGMIRRAPPAPAAAFDFNQALPRITGRELTRTPPERPEAKWTPAAPLASTDGGYVNLVWSDNSNSDFPAYYRWTIVVPPSATSVKAPAVPADVPKPTANWEVDLVNVVFAESTLLPGYKELKSLPIPAGAGSGLPTPRTPLPADGTVRITSAGPYFEE